MAIHPSKLGRISVAKQAAWGTMQTSFPAASYAECEVVLPTLAREALTTAAFKGSFHADRVVAGSRSGATVSLKMPLHGWSATLPTADPTSSDQTVESILLEYAMGGVYYNDIMSRTADGSTTSQITMSSGAASATEVGSCVLAQSAAPATEHQVGWIKSLSGGSDVELNLASVMPGLCTTDGALYGSMTHYISGTQPSVGLSMEYLGADATSRIILFDGCVGRVKITASPRAQPTLEADLHFADFSLVGSGGSPAAYAYALPQLPVAVGNNGTRLVIGGVAVAAITADFEVSCEYKAIGNHSSSEGVSQYVITNRTVSMTMETPATLVTDATVLAPGTELNYVQLDLNPYAPGSAASVLLPKAVVTEQSNLSDSEGIVSITSTMGAAYYDGDGTASSLESGSGSTTPADTVARVALL